MVSTRAQRQQREKDLSTANRGISPLLPTVPGLFFGKSGNVKTAVPDNGEGDIDMSTATSSSRGGARTRGTDTPRGKTRTRGKKDGGTNSGSKKSAGGGSKRGGRHGARKLSDGEHDYSPREKSVVNGRGRSKGQRADEVQDEAVDDNDETQATNALATAEDEFEPQQNPCEEFAALVKEVKARLATISAGATELENPAIAGAQLGNNIIDRAIASVTEAFGMGGPVFSLMHTEAMQAVLENPSNFVTPAHFHVIRPGHEAFVPRYVSKGQGGHISLYILRSLSPRGDFDMVHYDSSTREHHRGDFKEAAGSVRHALELLRWNRDAPALNLTEEVEAIHVEGRQRESWECGVYVILYAWAYALGLNTNGLVDNDRDRYHEFIKEAIEVINLAIQGQASSRMIEAFLKCFGFVPQKGTVPAERHFDNTHAFTAFDDLTLHIARQLHRENLDRLRASGVPLQNRAGQPLTLTLLLADLAGGGEIDIVRTSTADLLQRHRNLMALGAATNLTHLAGQLTQALSRASDDQAAADSNQFSAQERSSRGPSRGQSAVDSTSSTGPTADQQEQQSSGATWTAGSKRARTSAEDGAPSKKQRTDQQEDSAGGLELPVTSGSAVAADVKPASDAATFQPQSQRSEAQLPYGQVGKGVVPQSVRSSIDHEQTLDSDGDSRDPAGPGDATPGTATECLETLHAANELLNNIDVVSTPESTPSVLVDQAEVADHTIPIDVQSLESDSQERTYVSPGATLSFGSPPSREYGDENVAPPTNRDISSSPIVSGGDKDDVFGPRLPAPPVQTATSDERGAFSPAQAAGREEALLSATQAIPAATEIIDAPLQSDVLPVPNAIKPADSLSLFGDDDEVPPTQPEAETELPSARRPEGLRLDATPPLPVSPRRGLALPPPTPLNTVSPTATSASPPGLYAFAVAEMSVVPNVTEENVIVPKEAGSADVEDGAKGADEAEES